ncbi:MAG: autotransporter domain-containing protein [Aphanothece saxicola GSE-SYN-MK-01-06B]|jgi:uncharacterized protein with beta-barrel porin domain|nr:autotransporter domain-containing protein [Aphanothece saxicola GSE-SYN-MK-01-06B]
MQRCRLVKPVILAAFLCGGLLPVKAQFSGAYSPSQWTLTNSTYYDPQQGATFPANGYVDTLNAPASIQLTGPYFVYVGPSTPSFQYTSYTINADQLGTYTFAWSYASTDQYGPLFSAPSFINKGSLEAFAGFDSFGPMNQSGSGSYSFAANDLFGFQVECVDCVSGISSITISDFLFTPPFIPPSGIVSGNNATASNPYSTTFAGGTLLVDIPGIFPTSFNTGMGGTIDINGLPSIFTGVFSGLGNLSFVNSSRGGFLVLGGASTYTGSTTVGPGANLIVNGSIASSSGLDVTSGGLIGGNGSLPQTNLVAGARIAPGTSIGQITASGLSLNGGTIEAELQGPQTDRINVTGNVTNFSGTVNLMAFGGGTPWPMMAYEILSAPNSTAFASFNSVTLNPSGVTSALLQFGTTLTQEVDGNPRTFDIQWRPLNGLGATTSALQFLGKGYGNQLAAGGVFDRVFLSLASNAANNTNNTGAVIGTTGFTTGQAAAAGISPDFLSATNQLLSLTTGSTLIAAVSSLSPEPYAAFQSVGLNTLKRQRELLLGQAGNCSTTGWVVKAPARKDDKPSRHPFCFFAQGANATSSINGQNGLSSYNAGIFSTFYGVEYQAGPQWTLGAAYGYGSSYMNNMALSNGHVTANVNSVSLFGVYKPSPAWTLRGLFGYGSFNGNGSRTLSFIGNGSAITANPSADGFTLALNADVLIPLSKSTARTPFYLKPLLGIAWGSYQQGSFHESNSGALNLNVQRHAANSLLGTVGVELVTAPIPLNSSNTISITPRLAIAYQVDALGGNTENKSLTSSFVQAPAAGSFTTQGENRGTNTLTVDAGVDLKLAKNASIYANLGYEFFSNGSQFTYGGGLKVKF